MTNDKRMSDNMVFIIIRIFFFIRVFLGFLEYYLKVSVFLFKYTFRKIYLNIYLKHKLKVFLTCLIITHL